jgi:phosphoglycolate phosphatase-like HAD superfamily hydrolase
MSPAGRLVLFDLDGTLVDSSPGIHASVRSAAAELGLPEPSAAQLRAMVGPPLQEGFALVLRVPPSPRTRTAVTRSSSAAARTTSSRTRVRPSSSPPPRRCFPCWSGKSGDPAAVVTAR